MDFEFLKRQNIVKILQSLNFDVFLKKYSPKTVITSESFKKLSSLQFRLVCYFLFYKINPESCHLRFRNVFPSRDMQQEAEFRRLTIEHINELAHDQVDPLIKIEKIPPIHYQRLAGHVFIEQMFNLSLYVLIKYSSKLRTKIPNEIDKLDSVSKVENLVQEYQYQNNKFLSDLLEYEQKIEDQCKNYENKIERLNQSNVGIVLNGPIKEIEQVNDYLASKLLEIDRHLSTLLSLWRNSRSLLPMIRSTNQINEHVIQQFNIKNFPINLGNLLKQFEEFIQMIKNSPSEWLEAFQNFRQFNKAIKEFKYKIEQSESKILMLEQKELELRKTILKYSYVMNCRQQITDYLKPLLDLKLNFRVN